MRKLFLPSALICVSLIVASPANAEVNTRAFGAATAAVMGGIVGGPIGLVAGAVIGYALTPAVTVLSGTRVRHARRHVRRTRAVAATPAAAAPLTPQTPQAYTPYANPNPGQPMYMAQIPSPQPMQGVAPQSMQSFVTPTASQATPVRPAPQPVAPVPRPQDAAPGYAAPLATSAPIGQAQRPPTYARVPMPGELTVGGNYAARAYQPQDGSQTPDPLH